MSKLTHFKQWANKQTKQAFNKAQDQARSLGQPILSISLRDGGFILGFRHVTLALKQAQMVINGTCQPGIRHNESYRLWLTAGLD